MANDLELAIRRLCLAFPEAAEYSSHGMPNFRISGGKSFAVYCVNHHGDGRIALWLNVPDGAQDAYVRTEPIPLAWRNTQGTSSKAAAYRRRCRSQENTAWQTDTRLHAQDLPRPA
jgi:hypothetical protein